MLSRRITLIGLALCATACSAWIGGAPSGEVTPLEMQLHIDFLASDQLAGRDAGQPGAELAARYVAAEFARLGLSKLGPDWEMEFDLPGGAGKGSAELTLGETHLSGASLLGVPRCSAGGEVTAPLATEAAEDVTGALVLVETPTPGRELSDKAKAFLERGARGVVFLQEAPWLSRDSRNISMIWDDSDGQLMTMEQEGELVYDLSDLSPELQDQLKNMGADKGNARYMVMRRSAASQPSAADNAAPESIDDLLSKLPVGDKSGNITYGVSLLSHMKRLDGLVVQACGSLSAALHEAAEKREPVTLRVEHSGRDKSSNVLALIEGSDPVLKNECVIIGGHLDHIGVTGGGQVCNGANDNASGVAAVLEIAEALAAMPVKPKRTIILAAWGAEERGLIGSKAFVESGLVPIDRIAAYVNLDMIGRSEPDKIKLGASGETLTAWAREAAAENGLSAEDMGFMVRASDTSPFMEREIPIAFYSSGIFPGLHSPSDDADLIDADKAARVARAALRLACRLADSEERMEYAEPKTDGAGGLPTFSIKAGTGRLLGVVLDSGHSESVKIESVREKSVAAAAGIQAGDCIVRIGTQEIKTRSDIAPALKEIPDGVAFEIEVRRTGADGVESNVVLQGLFPAKSE